MRPHRNVPLPLLDDSGVGLLDNGPDAGQRLAPPIIEFLDFASISLEGVSFDSFDPLAFMVLPLSCNLPFDLK